MEKEKVLGTNIKMFSALPFPFNDPLRKGISCVDNWSLLYNLQT